MPKASRESAEKVVEFPVAIDRSSDLEGYTVNFVSILESHDLAPILAQLPEGHCTCPHWGYVLAGQITMDFGGRLETAGPGEAFYMPAGHSVAAEAGSEFVMFSPTDQLAATEAAIAKAMSTHSHP